MDTRPLVESRIKEGQHLLEKLVEADFDVSAAAWVQNPSTEKWKLYIVTKAEDQRGLSAARRRAIDILRRVEPFWNADTNLRLSLPDSPFGRHVLDLIEQYPGQLPIRSRWGGLGDVSALESFLYPPIAKTPPDQQPSRPGEVVQKVVGLMSRTGAMRPSHVALRDGTSFLGVPFGLELGGGGMQVKFAVEGLQPPRVCPVEAIQIID